MRLPLGIAHDPDPAAVLTWFAAAVLVASRAARAQRVWTVGRVKPELVL